MVIDIIVSDLVPLRQRGNYIAVVLLICGIGTSLGSFLGGAIVSATTWRWVFYINLPIGGALLLILYLCLHVNYNKEMSFARKIKRIDVIGNDILMAGTKLVPLFLGFLAFVLFAVYEAPVIPAEPVIPPWFFSNRTSVVALESPGRTGDSLLPQSPVGVPGAAVSAIALRRWGKYRPLHFCGFGIFTLGLGLFSLQREDTTTAQWAMYQSVCTVGTGMVLNTLLPAFQAPVSEANQATATATRCFISTLGYVWSVAIPAAIFNACVSALQDWISDPALRAMLADKNAYQMAAARFVEQYPVEVQNENRAVYREALERVWYIAVGFGSSACVLVFFEREILLRTALETEYGLRQSTIENGNDGEIKGEMSGEEKRASEDI
ncbi:hypothetical protein MMC25_000147 [Agyrium rufum]|nr:hypothetical protein [Agyrium rufum]